MRKKTIFATILCVLLSVNFFTESIFATTFPGIQNYGDISPTADQLKSITTTYTTTTFGISSSISKPYDVNIIRFKPEFTYASGFCYGWLSIYTTDRYFNGNDCWDTLGQVYSLQSKKSFLTKKYYVEKESDRDDDSGDGLNYHIDIRVTNGSEYYICTRAYSQQKAYYTLHVKPYQDILTSSTGGIWELDEDSGCCPSENANYYTVKKVYYNKTQTDAYYKLLSYSYLYFDEIKKDFNQGIRKFIRVLYTASENGYDIGSLFANIPNEWALLIAAVDKGIDLGLNYWEGKDVQNALSKLETDPVIQNLYKNMTQMKSQQDIKNRMNKITELCGCEFNSNMEYRKAKTGICIIDYKGNPQDVDYVEFTGIKRNLFVEPKITAFSGTTLTGEKYEKGKWILLQ